MFFIEMTDMHIGNKMMTRTGGLNREVILKLVNAAATLLNCSIQLRTCLEKKL